MSSARGDGRRAIIAAPGSSASDCSFAANTSNPSPPTLAEAGHRVAPGAVYYGVMQGERAGRLRVVDDRHGEVVDPCARLFRRGSPLRREDASRHRRGPTSALSRALRMRTFDFSSIDAEGAADHATGAVDGDSVLVLAIAAGRDKPATQRIPHSGPVLLPTLVPLAIALGEAPKVGKTLRAAGVRSGSDVAARRRVRRARRVGVRRRRQRGRFDSATEQLARRARSIRSRLADRSRQSEWRLQRMGRRAGTHRARRRSSASTCAAAVRESRSRTGDSRRVRARSSPPIATFSRRRRSRRTSAWRTRVERSACG